MQEQTTKTCTGPCGRTLPLDRFSLRDDTGHLRNECKDCKAAYRRKWYLSDTQRIKDVERARRVANRTEINARQRASYAALKTDPVRYTKRLAGEVARRERIGKEVLNAKSRAYWARTRDLQRAKRHVANYGLPLEVAEAIDAAQNGRCAVCTQLPKASKPEYQHLVSDHDHATGRFRGRICHKCNRALGYANDSPELLEALAAYLRAHH